jgi:hypothetical protein
MVESILLLGLSEEKRSLVFISSGNICNLAFDYWKGILFELAYNSGHLLTL